MDEQYFIEIAYGISAVFIGGLCLATWLRARRVRRILGDHQQP